MEYGTDVGMMNLWVRLSLLLIGLVAWVAAGAALATLRFRTHRGQRHDIGLAAVASALLGVGALCSAAASGLVSILAFGGVSVWVSYIITAQRIGLFRLESPVREEPTFEERRPRA